MRRLPAITLAAAMIAAALGVSTWSTASAEAPGDTPDTGSFYVTPDPPTVGEKPKLTANFPNGTFTVTFYKQTGDTWTSVGTDVSNKSGNAYLTTHAVTEEETLYARITKGGTGRTEEKTVTPVQVGPDGPDVASLYQDPATYSDGDLIKITANFPSGKFPITLFRETEANEWTAVETKQSNTSGNAYFSGFPVTDEPQRIFARKANNDRTEIDVVIPSLDLDLSIRRDCTGNSCGGTATAHGVMDPAAADRQLVLQRKSGSSWVSVGDATTNADGEVEVQFSLAGLSQWSAATYRLHGEGTDTAPTVTSQEIQFMPGPTTLGRNVMRIDVEDGIFPTSKGQGEFKGSATLSQDGNAFLEDFEVDEFGVRGSSTAKYAKKPYKLKFEESPKDTGVFGMGADKSWTLLASYIDQSFVRDKVGLDLGRRLDGLSWTPDSRYVELFVNDQYRGSYLMAESVKIDGDRVDVASKTGMIMETDAPNVTNKTIEFLSPKGKIPLQFKDPDTVKDTDDPDYEEGVNPGKLKLIKDRVTEFENKLYSSSSREQYPEFIDVTSAIDFMLVREFVKDNDSDFTRSNYFSWDSKLNENKPLRDRKFHFGPVWDFDRSAGNVDPDSTGHKYVRSPNGWMLRGTGTRSDSGRVYYKTHWFVQLFKSSTWEQAVDARWQEVKADFKQIGDAHVAELKAQIGVGAENDRKRWASEKKRYKSNGTFNDEITYVTDWYKKRYAWMNDNM